MFSIIIPTLNNLSYLKLCIESIQKNSKYNHEIINLENNNMNLDPLCNVQKVCIF